MEWWGAGSKWCGALSNCIEWIGIGCPVFLDILIIQNSSNYIEWVGIGCPIFLDILIIQNSIKLHTLYNTCG